MGFVYFKPPMTREEFNNRKKLAEIEQHNLNCIEMWLDGLIDNEHLYNNIVIPEKK